LAELKTKASNDSVREFLHGIADARLRADCAAVSKLMRQATQVKPRMWGSSIVGFGSYHYKYASGREGDWFLTGFSPRKQNLTLYIMPGFEQYAGLLATLGRFKTAKSCLYIKNLEEIDLPTLSELINQSVKDMIKAHG
jgi:hypothetical protein